MVNIEVLFTFLVQASIYTSTIGYLDSYDILSNLWCIYYVSIMRINNKRICKHTNNLFVIYVIALEEQSEVSWFFKGIKLFQKYVNLGK